jgi:ParB family chromosome partitioning protein
MNKKGQSSLDPQYQNQKVTKLKIADIQVFERIREAPKELDPLKESIAQEGLLQPILVDPDNRLIAGHRRLEAVKYLGWKYINAIVIPTKSRAEQVRIELDENRYHKPFTPQEQEKGEKLLQRLEHPTFWQRLADLFLLVWQTLKRAWRQFRDKLVANKGNAPKDSSGKG